MLEEEIVREWYGRWMHSSGSVVYCTACAEGAVERSLSRIRSIAPPCLEDYAMHSCLGKFSKYIAYANLGTELLPKNTGS
jgi:hypothetical protein